MDRPARTIMTIMFVTMFIMTPLAPIAMAMPEEGPSTGSRASMDPWVFSSAGLERQAIYDMAVGEVDPTSPGLEVLVTGGGGIVTQYSSETFEAKGVYSYLLTQHAVDIGDVQAGHPGNEIVSVGWDKRVHVLHRDSDGQWIGEIAWESIGSLNGATVGEFNQSHTGLEIAVTGDEAILAILTEDPSLPGGWSVDSMVLNTIPITNMMVHADDILPEWPGDEMLVGSFSGHAYLIRQDGQGGWNITVIWRDDYAILGFGTGGDLVPNITGPEIYISGFSGKVAVAYYNGTNWTVDEILQDRDPMYAVVPADVDPRYPGPELVAAGIGNSTQGIYMARYDNATGSWSVETVKDPKSDGSRLSLIYDIKVAELDSSNDGLEIMIGGFFQELIELTYVEPSFVLSAMPPTQTIVSGGDAEFWVIAEAVGNFEDQVIFSSQTAGVMFSSSVSSVGELVRVTVPTTAKDTDEDIAVVVNGRSSDITRSVTLKTSAKSRTSLGFDIQLFPDEQITVPGFATTFVARIDPINYFDGPVELSVEAGQGQLDIDIANPAQVDHPALITITPPSSGVPNLPYWSHHILIKGVGTLNESPGFSYENYVVASLTVDARGLPDFIMSVTPTHTRGITTSTVHFDLQITSPDYFREDVVISVDGVPKGSTGSFSATIVSLPAKVRYSLELGSVWGAGIPVLTFKATGGGVTHYAPASIYHLLTGFTNDFDVQVLPPTQVVSPGGTIQYLINGTGNKTIDEFEVDVGDSPFTAIITPGYDGNPDYRLMTVEVDKKAVPGKYTCKVHARSEWEHNDTFTVVVDEANDITLALAEEHIYWYPDYDAYFEIKGIDATSMITGGDLEVQVLGFSAANWSTNIRLLGVTVSAQIVMTIYRPNGTYMLALVCDVPGKPYPKVLIGKVTIAGPMPVLGLTKLEIDGSYREGGTMTITTAVNNWGKVDAHDVMVEFLVDGKLIGRKVIGTVPAGFEEVPVEVEWKGIEGDHNVTVVLSNEDGKVIEEKATVVTEVTVRPVDLIGPALAVLLVLMLGGLAFGLSNSARKDRTTRSRTKARIDEEE